MTAIERLQCAARISLGKNVLRAFNIKQTNYAHETCRHWYSDKKQGIGPDQIGKDIRKIT
jgi:hypothetical protein